MAGVGVLNRALVRVAVPEMVELLETGSTPGNTLPT